MNLVIQCKETRKSSCLNVRGIPPAILFWFGVPPRPDLGPDLDAGGPHPVDGGWGGGVLTLNAGTPPRRCEQIEKITFRHPSDADSNGRNFPASTVSCSIFVFDIFSNVERDATIWFLVAFLQCERVLKEYYETVRDLHTMNTTRILGPSMSYGVFVVQSYWSWAQISDVRDVIDDRWDR